MSAYKLSNLIRARFPVIYITTFEEDRVTKYIKSVVTDVKGFKYLYVTSFEPETTFSVPFGSVSLIVAVYVTVPALYGT